MIRVYNKTGRALPVSGITVPAHTSVEIDAIISDAGIRNLVNNGFIDVSIVATPMKADTGQDEIKQTRSKGKTLLLENTPNIGE